MPKIRLLSVISFLLLLNTSLVGQKSQLTLEQAVLEQGSTFAPKSIRGLQWLEDADAYSFEESGELKIKKVNVADPARVVAKTVFEELTGEKLSSIPSISWINAKEAYFRSGNALYVLNTENLKGRKLLDLPQGVKSIEINKPSLRVAYTVDGNVFLKKEGVEAMNITYQEGVKEVVEYGEAVHRFEFGIQKGMFWSPAGGKLAYYRNVQLEVQDYPLVDNTSLPAALKSIKYPMAGSANESVSLRIFDVLNGTTTKIERDPEFDYMTNVSWDSKGKYLYIALLNRGQNHMKLNKYDASTGELIKTLFEERKDTYVEPLFPVFEIPNGKGEFLWLSKREDFHRIYHYNSEGKLLKRLTNNDFEITSFLGFDKAGERAFFTATGELPTENHLYAVNLNNSEVQAQTKKSGTHQVQLSSSGAYFLDRFSNINTPNTIQLKSTVNDNKNDRILLEAENPLKNYQIATPKIYTIPSADAGDLYCRMIMPTNFDENKKYPVLVYVYNGPHVQLITDSWLAGARLWMYYMAEQGYIVFTLDGRGSSNRGTKFEEGIHRQLGKLEIEDQLKGIAHLKSLKYVDSERLAIHGWSFGGFMTTSLMLKHPDVFKVGVAGGPVTDWKFYEIMYTERYMDTPEENPEGYAQSSLLDKVSNLEGKLLLIHGLMDDVVVPQQNFALIREGIKEGVQLDFFPYPTHPHNVRGKDRLHLMRKVLTYVMDNNK